MASIATAWPERHDSVTATSLSGKGVVFGIRMYLGETPPTWSPAKVVAHVDISLRALAQGWPDQTTVPTDDSSELTSLARQVV
mmetsp:Transcript_98874/g.249684  ORF Transcript_98874/g.249684 Transcript_98874/m.249684 type:complete len:83 (-) Transcript_98874:380-628(-)